MKLKTNLFQGKKPSLEEGQMIYQIEADDIITDRIDRNGHCRRCVQCMKIFFFIVLILFILFVSWVGTLFLSNQIGYQEFREERMCGTMSLSEYDDFLRNNFQANSELGQKITSDDDDLVWRTWGDDTMETDTSTITSLSEGHEFDVEMVPSAARSIEEVPSEEGEIRRGSRIDKSRLIAALL